MSGKEATLPSPLGKWSADAWAIRGHVWGAKREFARAIADYDQSLRLKPRWADGYGYRGLARLMQGGLQKLKPTSRAAAPWAEHRRLKLSGCYER